MRIHKAFLENFKKAFEEKAEKDLSSRQQQMLSTTSLCMNIREIMLKTIIDETKRISASGKVINKV